MKNIALLALLAPLAILSSCATAAPAAPDVIAYQAPIGVAHALPALSTPLAQVRTFRVSCGTTATAISDGKSLSAMRVWNNSTTAVYLGGSDVNTSTKGMPICTTSSCIDDDMAMDARDARCVVASGSVTVTVIAGVL